MEVESEWVSLLVSEWVSEGRTGPSYREASLLKKRVKGRENDITLERERERRGGEREREKWGGERETERDREWETEKESLREEEWESDIFEWYIAVCYTSKIARK